MATIHFDGADDEIRGTGQGALNGAMSEFALVKIEDTGSVNQGVISAYNSSDGYEHELFIVNPTTGMAWDSGSSTTDPSTGITEDQWYLLGITKTAGTTAPRFHKKNLTTGTWTHADGGTALADPGTVSGGTMQIGNWGSTLGTLGEDFKGDIAIIAWWDGTALSDGHVEALAEHNRTSDWHRCAGGKPSSLTELTTLTPFDLEGLMTWSTITVSGLTGGDPPGWHFDGIGRNPVPEYARFPKHKLRRRSF